MLHTCERSSTVDDGHVSLLVALACSRSEVVEPLDLLRAQLDTVGCGVLLDARDALGAGDRGDVVALGKQPGQSNVCRCRIELGGDGLDLVDDAEVLLEVALGEARVVLAPVVVGEVLGGADGSRVQSEYSVCSAASGCTAWARRIVAGAASDNPMCRTLPSATSSAKAPTVSSIGVF